MKQKILHNLSPDYPWADRFHYVPETGSTNDDLKALAKEGAPHGTVLMAGSQTGGHGRLGRSFHSPEGSGIYMSLLIRPNCAPTELMHLTCAAAAAMYLKDNEKGCLDLSKAGELGVSDAYTVIKKYCLEEE